MLADIWTGGDCSEKMDALRRRLTQLAQLVGSKRERGVAAVQKEKRIRSDLSRSQPSSAQHGQETWLPTASASAALLGSRFDLKQRETPISIQGLLKGSVSLV